MKYFQLNVMFVYVFFLSFSAHAKFKVENPCTLKESWTFQSPSSAVSSMEWNDDDFEMAYFIQLRALSKNATSNLDKALFDYYYARSVFLAGFDHFAWQEFSNLMKRSEFVSNSELNFALMSCMDQALQKNPRFEVTKDVYLFFKGGIQKIRSEDRKKMQIKYAMRMYRQLLAQANVDEKEIVFLENILSQNKENFLLAQGLKSALKNDHENTVKNLKPFLAQSQSSDNTFFQGAFELAQILLGRASYALKDYDGAQKAYEMIQARSNFVVDSLLEKSYNYFQKSDYSSALGTALSLHRGAFKKAFHPEVELLAATIYYEICQYSEVGQSIHVFKANYIDTQKWLTKVAKNNSTSYYATLLNSFKGASTDLPQPVLTEWLKSPIYISLQEEMNSVIDQRAELLKKLSETENLRNLASQTKGFESTLDAERKKWNSYTRYLDRIEKNISAQIETELHAVVKNIRSRLNATIESFLLLRADVYKELAYVKTEKDKEKISQNLPKGGTVWDWGKAQIGKNSASAEVWDDEIGAMKSNLPNVCLRTNES